MPLAITTSRKKPAGAGALVANAGTAGSISTRGWRRLLLAAFFLGSFLLVAAGFFLVAFVAFLAFGCSSRIGRNLAGDLGHRCGDFFFDRYDLRHLHRDDRRIVFLDA